MVCTTYVVGGRLLVISVEARHGVLLVAGLGVDGVEAKVGDQVVGAAVHHDLERLLPLRLQLLQLRAAHLLPSVPVHACRQHDQRHDTRR